MLVRACVCVREREREREGDIQTGKQIDTDRRDSGKQTEIDSVK